MAQTCRGPAPVQVGPLAPWMHRRLRRLMRAHRGDAAIPLRARVSELTPKFWRASRSGHTAATG